MYNQQLLGIKIRELRTKNKFSQKTLSNLSGIPQSTLSALENGTGSVNIDKLGNLASALNTSLDDLLHESLVKYSNSSQEEDSFYFLKLQELLQSIKDEDILAEIDDFVGDYFEYKLLQKKKWKGYGGLTWTMKKKL